MTRYYIIEDNVEKVTEFKDDIVYHPRHQCEDCGHSISPSFAHRTGVCGMCHKGINEISEYLDRIYSVTFYCSEFSDHSLTNAIQNEVKQGKYVGEMAQIIEWGIRNFDISEEADYITPPPRGTDDADINHMEEIGRIVSGATGIPLENPLRKRTSYTSQKSISNAKERLNNVKDKIKSIESFEENPTIILIDDVATSTGTLKYSAKALLNSGAGQVVGLVIARSEGIDNLEKAEVVQEGDDED
jgi:predicted amidophosphoribosyltransferase